MDFFDIFFLSTTRLSTMLVFVAGTVSYTKLLPIAFAL